MRVPVWMLAGLLVSILIMDITSVWLVRGKIISTAETALDAALVGGINKDEASRGVSSIDEIAGEQLAAGYFCESLKLDSRLENNSLKITGLTISFLQDGDRIRAFLDVSAVIQAMSTRVVGLEGVPITIKKNQFHLSAYK